MNNLLRAQFLNLRSYSAKTKSASKMKVLAGIFFLAALLSSKETLAQGPCFNGATLTSTATSVCTNDSVRFTVTGSSAGVVASGPWSATYQWQRSTTGIAGPYSNVAGATGTISDGSPFATYNTGALVANACYQVVLTGIVGPCSVGTSTLTTNQICITVNPRPAPITGTLNFCEGTISCLSDITPGGTWSSTDPAIALVPSTASGCVTGINAGTSSIIYTLAGCSSVSVVTVSITGNINGPSEVCQGSNITLTDTTVGVTWSSSNTGVATINPSGVVSGLAGGTTIITATSPLGCTATTVITVNPLPAAITGNLSICIGLTNCLTDAATGGTWSSSNTTVGTVDVAGCVTGLGVGTSTITYTLATGCLITAEVTVNALPTAILGTASLCSGTTTSLSNATPGGTWSTSAPAVATVSGSGVVSGLLPGTSTITYALSTGCIATVVVTVNPIAPISGNLNICGTGPTSTTTLSDIYTGGTWSASNGNATVGSSSGVVTGQFQGIVDITYTLPFGCTATVTVTVQPLPASITGVTNVCVGATTALTDATAGGTWSSSNAGAALVGSSTGLVTGVSNGTSTITYTLPTGCITTIDVTVNPVALISGPTSVCQGGTISLSDATPGGTWSSLNIGVATVDFFGNVTGLLAGTSTISYVIAATGCYATVDVTVNALPGPISGVLNACAWGGVSCLTDASAGGVWTSTLVIISSAGCVTAFDTGLATITYTLPTGCSATTNFTVNPLPEPITGNTTVCVGFTTTLNDASPGGTWSSFNTSVATVGSSTGVVTGVFADTTTIIYTLPTGCVADTTVTVLPVPSVITGITEVCVGSVTSLTDVTAGGTWSSSDNAMAAVDGSGNVTGVGGPGGVGGTATITYSLPTGCFATITVTVDPLPAPITGPSVVCMGQTISLNDATPGGTWSSTNLAAGTVDATGDVTGILTGTTTISYTIAPFGCAATLVVTVYPLYPITGNVPFCGGQSITLSDSAAGGTWSSVNPGIGSVGSSSGVVTGTGAAGGTTTIIYTLSTGCTTNVIVTINPVPLGITGVTTVCVGQTTALTDATVGGNWSSSDPTIALVGATGIVTGIAPGTVTITYQIPSSCYVTTTVTVYPLSPITGNASICLGSSSSLTDATPGGSWTSTNTAVATVDGSGNLTSVSVGTTTISYLLPTGCLATVDVTVNPFAQISGGNVELCVGSSITLSDAATGGTWSSSSISVATVGSLTGVVTGAGPGPGTATISYILPTGCTAVTTVTVDALEPITGPTSVCVGSTIQLSDVTPGGTWSSSNPGIGSISATGVVTGVSAGTFVVSYSYGANCWAIYSVVVNPMSPIFGSPALCPGVCTTLSDTTVGGTWSSTNTAIATIGSTTGLLCAIAPGTATITYLAPTGCFAILNVTVDVVLPLTGNAPLCPGGSLVLTDAVSGGTWSSNNTAVATVGTDGTVTADPLNTGTATITYTLPTGCVALAVITVNPNPAPITGPTAVCAYGSTIQLSDATAGGIWTSSTAPIGSTGILTGAAAGVTTVTYTLPTGCAVYYLVTVNPLPNPINGNLVVCQGLTTTLTDATPGGTWSSSNTGIATIGSNTGLVTGVLSGTAFMTYTLPTGCFVDTIITVNPNPLPINGTLSVCVGLTTTLTDATSGGVWTSGSPLIASIGSSSGIVTGNIPGTAIITYTLLTGCINTAIVTVNPNPTAILGSSTVCVGQTTTLTDITPGGSWTSSNTVVATIGSSTGVVLGVSAGTTIITYTLATGCITTRVITVNPLSVITGTPSVCIGLTTALTDATPGGTWSSSNTAVGTVGSLTGIVTGRTAGTTTISYIMPTGCTATLVVTVYPLPTPILGSLSACVGQTITLSDGTPGGTWSSSNTAVATIGSSSGILLGVSAGTTIVSYTLGTGCVVTAIVTVNPLAPISGVTNLCQGQTTTLSDAVAGGTWSALNGNAVIDGSGNITGVTVGTDVITYTLPSGCTTTITVTVNPLAPINGTTELCVGSSTIFTDAVLGGTWVSSVPGVANVTLLTGIVTGISSGTTIISYITPGSGCTATIIVTVAPVPTISGPSSVCQNDSITLTSSVPGGSWSTSNPFTATVSSTGVVYGHHSGTVVISFNYGPGCFATKTIIVNPASPILGNLNVCQGLTTILSDTTLGGTWSSSNYLVATAGPGGVVTGLGSGGLTATITYTTPAGCIITAVVTVNATSPIQGMDSVCVGLTTTLTDATAGVTWSSSNPSIASIGSASGVVTGNTPGTVTITATSPLGCIATVVITVNPNPTPILGTPVVCFGLTTTLSDLTPGGSWSSSDPTIASVNPATGVVTGTGAAGGTATITYTLPTTCITTIVVTVNPLPAPITGTLVVCETFTTQLSDVTPGGTWTSGNTAVGTIDATGLFTGISAGTSIITYTIGTGCIITAVVTVNPLPAPIVGNPHICLGTTVLYSDATPGGVFSSSNPLIAPITPGGSAFGLALGVDTITYQLSTTGCYVTLSVTVDPLPLPITGPNQVCVGSTIQLTDATPGGTWSSSNVAVGTIGLGTGIQGGISAGVVTDTYTIFATGCYVTTTVTVNPLPQPILGNFSVCIGTTNTLTDSDPGGTWMSSNISIAPIGSATGIVFGNNLGTAIITYTLPTGCEITQEVTVNPLPAPITGSVPVCVGDSITLSDITPGGTWTSSLIDTANFRNDTTGIIGGIHSGTTTVTYTLTNTGCIATAIVTVNPLPSIITGNNTLCLHDTTTLSDNSLGGVWASNDTTIATIDTNGLVTGVNPGSTTITYSLPTGCFVTFGMTIFPLPPAITGDSVVCVNAFITLSDSSVGGTWTVTPATKASIGISSGILTGIDSSTAVVVTYTSNVGCTTTKHVTVNPIPTPIFGTQRVCAGFSVALNDTSLGGVWSSSNTLIDTVSTTGIVTGIAPGTDSIFYTYPATGCFVFVTFTVNPIPVITVASSPNAQICIGGSVILTASGAATPGGTAGSYAWAPPTGLSATAGASVVASPTVTTTYTVTGTTQFGCSSDTTVTVYVDSLLRNIHITGRDSICAGDADTLIADGYHLSLFSWSPSVGLSCVICDTTIARIITTTTYIATAIDSFGCKYTASFTVTVNPLPVVLVMPNPTIVCRGSSTQLTATGAATYTWFPNAFLSCDSCANPIASDTQNLVYNVIGTSIYGCRDSVLVPVSVLDTNINTISNDTILCFGQSAQLIATSTDYQHGRNPDYYLWIPSTGLSDPNSPTPIAKPDTTTTYTVIIKENACFSDTEHVTVFVQPFPSITITSSQLVVAGTAVQLHASIGNEVLLSDYEWTPADYSLSCTKCFAPIATPTVGTTYTFTATSVYGCSSSAEVTISLFCDGSQVFIPNTFTPNGDGANDRFYISAKGVSLVTRLSVYNRWGELVFEQLNAQPNDPAAGWDGTYKGVVLEPDVFVYVAEVICEIGNQPFSFKGDVSIVR